MACGRVCQRTAYCNVAYSSGTCFRSDWELRSASFYEGEGFGRTILNDFGVAFAANNLGVP